MNKTRSSGHPPGAEVGSAMRVQATPPWGGANFRPSYLVEVAGGAVEFLSLEEYLLAVVSSISTKGHTLSFDS